MKNIPNPELAEGEGTLSQQNFPRQPKPDPTRFGLIRSLATFASFAVKCF